MPLFGEEDGYAHADLCMDRTYESLAYLVDETTAEADPK